ncbi:MAG: MBL fold metallo-hydrolase [Cyclobacteriaceae bacterium]|nr:MBL fold metallo-hydrolase [Cyclobacteriaceae bacterium]
MNQSFGKLPSGDRLGRIKASPNYRNGSFQNLTPTQMLAEGASYPKMLINFFSKGIDREPVDVLPSVKTDLKSLPNDKTTIVWFGHSSYFIKLNGKNIFIDPVFSERTSPFQFIGKKAYAIETPYSLTDFPDTLDLVILTHDHYDHLDYHTMLKLHPRVKQFYTSLGVGSHLEYWGVNGSKISEFDWWESRTFESGIDVIAAPSRHFSGRGLTRNQTLWSSFILKTDSIKIYVGGDSGYDPAFAAIGNQYGPFDLALLECGQYNTMWPNIHMMPEEVAHAAVDLKAKVFMPVHWAKFTLALHTWKDPIERTTAAAERLGISITTPMIGEPVVIGGELPKKRWWEGVK